MQHEEAARGAVAQIEKAETRDFWYLAAALLVICSIALVFYMGDLKSFLAMKPNEWGDFLAGIFGPATFLILARGYFLQRQELRLQRQELAANRAALLQQHEELHRSADQSEAQTKILAMQSITEEWSLTISDLDAYIIWIFRKTHPHISGHKDRVAVPSPSSGELPIWVVAKIALIKYHNEGKDDLVALWKDICYFLGLDSDDVEELKFFACLLQKYEDRLAMFISTVEKISEGGSEKFLLSSYGILVPDIGYLKRHIIINDSKAASPNKPIIMENFR